MLYQMLWLQFEKHHISLAWKKNSWMSSNKIKYIGEIISIEKDFWRQEIIQVSKQFSTLVQNFNKHPD